MQERRTAPEIVFRQGSAGANYICIHHGEDDRLLGYLVNRKTWRNPWEVRAGNLFRSPTCATRQEAEKLATEILQKRLSGVPNTASRTLGIAGIAFCGISLMMGPPQEIPSLFSTKEVLAGLGTIFLVAGLVAFLLERRLKFLVEQERKREAVSETPPQLQPSI